MSDPATDSEDCGRAIVHEVTKGEISHDGGEVTCPACEYATPIPDPNRRRLSFDCEHCDATLRLTIHALTDEMFEHDRDEIRRLQNDVGMLADRVRSEHPALAGYLEGIHEDLREAERMLLADCADANSDDGDSCADANRGEDGGE
jgi:hypothetical protein